MMKENCLSQYLPVEENLENALKVYGTLVKKMEINFEQKKMDSVP